MIYGIYSIRDAKTGFLPPTTDINDDSAKRNFEFAFSKTDSLFVFSSSDYTLYKLGEYNTDTGEIIPELPPTWLLDAPIRKEKENE